MSSEKEKFEHCHKDCILKDDNITIENYYQWCYHRTCYGQNEIPTYSNIIATWTIKIKYISLTNGDVGVGIDSINHNEQTDIKFYANQRSPNYCYDCTGNGYKIGQMKQMREGFFDEDEVTIELNTISNTVCFYKKRGRDTASNSQTLQHTFNISCGPPQLIYRLAVCVKNAKVSIVAFEMKPLSSIEYPIEHQNTNITVIDEKKDDKQCMDAILQTNSVQRAQIMSLNEAMEHKTKEFDQLQRDYGIILEQLQLYKECKDVPPDKAMENIQQRINNAMVAFEKMYNENTMVNSTMISFKDQIANIKICLHKFNDCIEHTEIIGNKLLNLQKENDASENSKVNTCVDDEQKLQNLLNEESKAKHTDVIGQNGLSKILIDLQQEIEAFKHKYNENNLKQFFDQSPEELMQKDSEINKHMNGCNNVNENMILLCKSFGKYISDIHSFIKKISTFDVNEYKTWNLSQMMAWIVSLDNGMYVKYSKQLSEAFIKSKILSGDLLPELTRSDLSNPPFNIDEFIIKRNLEKHFKSLQNMNTNENNAANLIKCDNNDRNEGDNTQYIDR